jgi:hypothetical protein
MASVRDKRKKPRSRPTFNKEAAKKFGIGAAGLLADFTPVVGDAKGLYEGIQDLKAGNTGMGLLGVAGAVPLLGTPADIARKALKAKKSILWDKSNLDAIGMTPNQYDFGRNPNYFKREKGFIPEYVEMSPDEYIEEAASRLGMQTDRSAKEVIEQRLSDKKYLDDLEAAITTKPTAPPYLDYRFDSSSSGQEGLHRSLIAKRLGVEKMPVMIMRDTPEAKASRAARGLLTGN